MAGPAAASSPDPGPPPSRVPAFPPLAFGRFVIGREVGRGRNSVVYRAVDPEDQAVVALKIVYPSEDRPTLDVTAAALQREAQRLRLLAHPNIVGVREAGVAEGHAYIVFPFVRGLPLDRALSVSMLPREQAIEVLIKVAEAVQHAHTVGLIHRDLKPGNILVGAGGEPFVLDFGLSWQTGDRSEPGVQQIVGTPAYMSPEQIRGEERRLTPATDVYSLGAILYEILTGRPPFAGETAWKTRQLALSEAPAPPRQLDPSIDPEWERIVLWCLQKEPGKRYASAAALAQDLRRVLRKLPAEGPGATTLWRRWFG